MECKVLKVSHCGPIAIEQMQELLDGVAAINATLNGELTVQPGDQWQALLTTAIEAADIVVTVGDTVTVVVDTTNGPVEVTGTMTVNGTVSVDNFPTSFSIDNFADIAGVELTVTLDGETVTVTPDAAFTAAMQAIVDAINSGVRVDYEETGMCVVDVDGLAIDPPVKQYVEKRYDHLGNFLSNTVVLSQFQTDGTITGYVLQAGETVAVCPTDNTLLQSIVDLLQSVIGDPEDPCNCDDMTGGGAGDITIDPADCATADLNLSNAGGLVTLITAQCIAFTDALGPLTAAGGPTGDVTVSFSGSAAGAPDITFVIPATLVTFNNWQGVGTAGMTMQWNDPASPIPASTTGSDYTVVTISPA